MRGYKMPPLIFTPEEATAVTLGTSLVEEIWGSLYHEAALGALAKLENVLPDEQQQEIDWARRSLVVTGLHRAELNALAPMLEKLRRGLRELRTVNLVYRSSSRTEPQRRDLDPYILVHRWGWCTLYFSVRHRLLSPATANALIPGGSHRRTLAFSAGLSGPG